MSLIGTTRTSEEVQFEFAKRTKADMNLVGVTIPAL